MIQKLETGQRLDTACVSCGSELRPEQLRRIVHPGRRGGRRQDILFGRCPTCERKALGRLVLSAVWKGR